MFFLLNKIISISHKHPCFVMNIEEKCKHISVFPLAYFKLKVIPDTSVQRVQFVCPIVRDNRMP